MQPDFFSGNNAPISDKPQEYGINSLPLKSRKVLAEVISGRIQFLKETISEIKTQVTQRQDLKDKLSYGIDLDICEIRTAVYDLEASVKQDQQDKNPLERQIVELRMEKRRLELSSWQDMITLNRELREAEKELRSALLDLWMLNFVS